MQRQHLTTAPQAPVILDPQAHVSRHVARRVRELIGQVRVWSIDGMDARERRDLLAVGGHRLELATDDHGRALGRCDCRAARFGVVCSHLLALAVHAVALGWEAA